MQNSFDSLSHLVNKACMLRVFPTGRLEEVYHSPEPGIMHVTSTVYLGNQSIAVLQASVGLGQVVPGSRGIACEPV
jgi:hypothetical protein